MQPADLFIGVVSHSASPYAENITTEGLGAQLAQELSEYGVRCSLSVNLEDLYTGTGAVPSPRQARAGLRAEVRLARDWNVHIERRLGLKGRVEHLGRWANALIIGTLSPNVSEISRLRNIEESHVSLFRRGVESGATWVLILEDDAASRDVRDLAQGIRGIMLSTGPKFVNLSHSFTVDELGIRHLLNPAQNATWLGKSARTILVARKPITNTVCAILYHRGFLQDLLLALGKIPENPVVPIDWRLNSALMSMWQYGDFLSEECWFIDPAPIDQLSMHS